MRQHKLDPRVAGKPGAKLKSVAHFRLLVEGLDMNTASVNDHRQAVLIGKLQELEVVGIAGAHPVRRRVDFKGHRSAGLVFQEQGFWPLRAWRNIDHGEKS